MVKLVKMARIGQNSCYGVVWYGNEYGWYWFSCEDLYKRRSPVKTELKNMHRIKSYGQNKIGCEILAISFVFWPILRPKMAFPEAALPMGSQSSSLYFWNQWNQENGISFWANSKFDFCSFWPPLILAYHSQHASSIIKWYYMEKSVPAYYDSN